ncbi:MAG: hypothetical protein GY757_11295 [bacterium]|nr:hypothetical protein [bacterium]
MLKKSILLIVVLLISSFVFAGNVITLKELVNPSSIDIDRDQIFITEKTTVYIYSAKDFTLIKKFGKEGEGPQEFKNNTQSNIQLVLSFTPEHIVISSMNKLSFFTREGKFVKENKVDRGFWIRQLGNKGDRFVGVEESNDGKFTYFAINLYDGNLKKTKELTRKRNWFQESGKLDGIDFSTPDFALNGDKIVTFAGGVSTFDSNGKKIKTLDYKFKKKKVTQEDKKRYTHWMKTSPVLKNFYERLLKKRIVYSDYFPDWHHGGVYKDGFYLVTYTKQNGKSEVYFFDMESKFKGKALLNIVPKDIQAYYSYTMYNGKIYQLLESESGEEWKLQVTDIK